MPLEMVAVHDRFGESGTPRPADEEIPATDSRHRGRRGSSDAAPEVGLARNAKKSPQLW